MITIEVTLGNKNTMVIFEIKEIREIIEIKEIIEIIRLDHSRITLPTINLSKQMENMNHS